MSYAIIKVIYGVPLTTEVSQKMREWEENGDERWTDECGFTILYSAGGCERLGYCGVEIKELPSYEPYLLKDIPEPTEKQKRETWELTEQLDPELRKLAGDIGLYIIWSDS
jgi:hypothetical protein